MYSHEARRRTAGALWLGVLVGFASPTIASCSETTGDGTEEGDGYSAQNAGSTLSAQNAGSTGYGGGLGSGVSASGSGGSTAQFTDSCATEVLWVGLGSSTTIPGSTTTATGDYSTSCGDTTRITADVVIGLEVWDPCTLELNLNDIGAFDAVLSIRTQDCDVRVNGDVCLDGSTDNEAYKMYAAGRYFIVIEGADGSTGDFSLSITCSTSACGDGVVGPAEECDTGPGVTPSDGCGDVGQANACQVEP